MSRFVFATRLRRVCRLEFSDFTRTCQNLWQFSMYKAFYSRLLQRPHEALTPIPRPLPKMGYVSLALTHPFFNIQCLVYSLAFPASLQNTSKYGSSIIVKCHFIWPLPTAGTKKKYEHHSFLGGFFQKKEKSNLWYRKYPCLVTLDGGNNGLYLHGAHLLSTVNLIYPRFVIFHSLCETITWFSFQSSGDNETLACLCIKDH